LPPRGTFRRGDKPVILFFGRIHPRFRTPANAVVFTSIVALLLGISGSFAAIAVVSALARLVTYTGACAATLRLRSRKFAVSASGPPRSAIAQTATGRSLNVACVAPLVLRIFGHLGRENALAFR